MPNMASRLPLLNPRVWKIDRCARYVPLLEGVLAERPSLNGDRLSLATGRMCLALLPDTIVCSNARVSGARDDPVR